MSEFEDLLGLADKVLGEGTGRAAVMGTIGALEKQGDRDRAIRIWKEELGFAGKAKAPTKERKVFTGPGETGDPDVPYWSQSRTETIGPEPSGGNLLKQAAEGMRTTLPFIRDAATSLTSVTDNVLPSVGRAVEGGFNKLGQGLAERGAADVETGIRGQPATPAQLETRKFQEEYPTTSAKMEMAGTFLDPGFVAIQVGLLGAGTAARAALPSVKSVPAFLKTLAEAGVDTAVQSTLMHEIELARSGDEEAADRVKTMTAALVAGLRVGVPAVAGAVGGIADGGLKPRLSPEMTEVAARRGPIQEAEGLMTSPQKGIPDKTAYVQPGPAMAEVEAGRAPLQKTQAFAEERLAKGPKQVDKLREGLEEKVSTQAAEQEGAVVAAAKEGSELMESSFKAEMQNIKDTAVKEANAYGYVVGKESTPVIREKVLGGLDAAEQKAGELYDNAVGAVIKDKGDTLVDASDLNKVMDDFVNVPTGGMTPQVQQQIREIKGALGVVDEEVAKVDTRLSPGAQAQIRKQMGSNLAQGPNGEILVPLKVYHDAVRMAKFSSTSPTGQAFHAQVLKDLEGAAAKDPSLAKIVEYRKAYSDARRGIEQTRALKSAPETTAPAAGLEGGDPLTEGFTQGRQAGFENGEVDTARSSVAKFGKTVGAEEPVAAFEGAVKTAEDVGSAQRGWSDLAKANAQVRAKDAEATRAKGLGAIEGKKTADTLKIRQEKDRGIEKLRTTAQRLKERGKAKYGESLKKATEGLKKYEGAPRNEDELVSLLDRASRGSLDTASPEGRWLLRARSESPVVDEAAKRAKDWWYAEEFLVDSKGVLSSVARTEAQRLGGTMVRLARGAAQVTGKGMKVRMVVRHPKLTKFFTRSEDIGFFKSDVWKTLSKGIVPPGYSGELAVGYLTANPEKREALFGRLKDPKTKNSYVRGE